MTKVIKDKVSIFKPVEILGNLDDDERMLLYRIDEVKRCVEIIQFYLEYMTEEKSKKMFNSTLAKLQNIVQTFEDRFNEKTGKYEKDDG